MTARRNLPRATLASVIIMACAGSTLAADGTKPECPTPTKEIRERMAAEHEQMAACLRSNKALTQCRTEMAKNHQEVTREMGCPGSKMRPNTDKHPQTAPQK